MVEYLNIKLNAINNFYLLSNTLFIGDILITSFIRNYHTRRYISEIGFNDYSFLLTNQSNDINIYKTTNGCTKVTLVR